MRTWIGLLILPVCLTGQMSRTERGAVVFRKTCAVAYCHGPEGTAGRAPRLIGHPYPENIVFSIVADGISGKGMPGFSSQLKTEEIDAVVGYVMMLRSAGPPAAVSAAKLPRVMPTEIRKGRDLFFDAPRLGACNACHQIGDRGTPAGPNLAGHTAFTPQELTDLPAPHVVTVHPDGEGAFPGIAIGDEGLRIQVYDLSAVLPVRRIFHRDQAKVVVGGVWSHKYAAGLYSSAEIQLIGEYLRWVK
ncbi:MAG: c-type cytochrome [Bryobacteraceae bacterium]